MSELDVTNRLIEVLQRSNDRQSEVVNLADGSSVLVCDGVIIKEIPKQRKVGTVDVATLTGLVDYCKANRVADEALRDYALSVVSPDRVNFIEITGEEQIFTHVRAIAPCHGSPIEITRQFVSIADAVIQLRLNFEPTDTVEKLVQTISKVKIENLVELREGPLGSEVAVLSNVGALDAKETSTVENLRLRPYRTFPEIAPADVAYTMRWKKQGEKDISIRLIEHQPQVNWAMGIEAIRDYLSEHLSNILVLA